MFHPILRRANKQERSEYPVEEFRREMNRLFDDSLSRFFNESSLPMESAWMPSVDVIEEKDKILIRAELPEIKKGDIEISVQDNILILRGEKKQAETKEDKNAIRSECFYGHLQRTFTLPAEVDANNIQANYTPQGKKIGIAEYYTQQE